MKKTNIFKYATKELSQDAFICWSIAWADQTDNIPMRQYAIDLLNSMLALHDIHIRNLNQIQSLKIEKQYKNIDVFISFEFGGCQYAIIFEDKTNTTFHSNQLTNYFNKIRKEKKEGQDLIVLGIYYKTGFLYDNEVQYISRLRNQNIKFQILKKEDMITCMKKHHLTVKSDFFQDYYSYLLELQKKEEDIRNAFDSDHMSELLDTLRTQEGQWIFMRKLFATLTGVSIHRGTSRGRPWTQCSFRKQRESLDFPDALFYRLDRRRGGIYLSVRQYFDYKNKKNLNFLQNNDEKVIRKNKVNRLNVLKSIFDETIEELKRSHPKICLNPGKKVTDRAGYKESEIGVFFLSKELTIPTYKEFIPIFHHLFTEKVNENFGTKIL